MFEWRGVDGSSVRAEYLPAGYGNAAYLLSAGQARRRGRRVVEAMRPFFGDDPVLAMYGTDHQAPLPELVDVVERANAESDRRADRAPRTRALR